MPVRRVASSREFSRLRQHYYSPQNRLWTVEIPQTPQVSEKPLLIQNFFKSAIDCGLFLCLREKDENHAIPRHYPDNIQSQPAGQRFAHQHSDHRLQENQSRRKPHPKTLRPIGSRRRHRIALCRLLLRRRLEWRLHRALRPSSGISGPARNGGDLCSVPDAKFTLSAAQRLPRRRQERHSLRESECRVPWNRSSTPRRRWRFCRRSLGRGHDLLRRVQRNPRR